MKDGVFLITIRDKGGNIIAQRRIILHDRKYARDVSIRLGGIIHADMVDAWRPHHGHTSFSVCAFGVGAAFLDKADLSA